MNQLYKLKASITRVLVYTKISLHSRLCFTHWAHLFNYLRFTFEISVQRSTLVDRYSIPVSEVAIMQVSSLQLSVLSRQSVVLETLLVSAAPSESTEEDLKTEMNIR
jgi:hypothetical protein